jgi:hypothetical protein
VANEAVAIEIAVTALFAAFSAHDAVRLQVGGPGTGWRSKAVQSAMIAVKASKAAQAADAAKEETLAPVEKTA